MRTPITTTTTAVGLPPHDLELGHRTRNASDSGAFWRNATPELHSAIARHNARIGTRVQRAVSGFFRIYVFGPLFFAALRIFFRVRVMGTENLARERWRAIFAIRHFFEWDPFISYWGSLFPAAFWRPYLTPITLAGHFWTRTPLRRAASWIFCILGLARGEGPEQGAVARMADLLHADPRARKQVAMFPTGPVGRSLGFEVKPGLAHLARLCPDVAIIPVALVGVRDLRLGEVLRLRRPTVTIRLDAPFRWTDLQGTDEARMEAIGRRVADAWIAAEARPLA